MGRRRKLLGVGLALVAVAGCASAEGSEDAAPTTAAPPASALPSTTLPTTTLATTTVATTVPTTTTTLPPETVPTPAAPPAAGSWEPEAVVATIQIPKIAVASYLFEGVSDVALDRGPGHWPGTALPGRLGNVVVGGHRVSEHAVFRNLDQLTPGDQLVFGTPEGEQVYEVTGTQILNPDAMWIVDQRPERTATLFACHPPGSTRQRIVVFAKLRGS